MGLGLASALLAGGAEVAVVARAPTAEALRARGLRRRGVLGEAAHAAGSFDAASALDALPPRPAAYALVATQAFDVERAARELAAAPPSVLAADAPVVFCQNGWGHAETAAAVLGRARVFRARVITGFRRPTPAEVEVTVHAQPVHMGSLFGEPPARLEPLCAALDRGGLPCAAVEDVAADLLAKLLYNATLNPLGAILRVPYGGLAESTEGRALLAAIAGETFAAIAAAGLRTHWETADAWLADLHARLLPPTASHESSMLQALRAGRRTEIDAISGAVVRLAAAHGVDVPVTRALHTLVAALEARRGAS